MDKVEYFRGKLHDLMMCETTHNLSVFDFLGWCTLLRMGYKFGEILRIAIPSLLYMMCSGHTYNTCSIDAVEIRAVFAWRHNAIGSEKEYTVEFFKLIGLFPPCVAIVARKMRVFLECRIILTRKHLGMGIDIDAFPSCLLKQFFKVFEVVSADKDARIVADTYIDLSYFGITVGSGIRAVKEFHRLHSSFADIQHERKQFIDTDIPTGCLGQCILDYGIHILILITEIGGMAGVCCHTFTTINGKLFESAYILVGVSASTPVTGLYFSASSGVA